ncbi:glutaminyl-peptide cyclotransferase [Streptomyces sp. NPDC047023]|uniref:glutaminyl-peptide cyclotransferase n=1 Tax=Streptomyces sp. NPDC047023 TaxID=3155139 RepID=UPI00340FE204
MRTPKRRGAVVTAVMGAVMLLCAAVRPSDAEGVGSFTAVADADYPHSTSAWTQGLESSDGILYESGGGFGTSFVSAGRPGREPRTQVGLPADLYAEGITVGGGRLWQLTWRNGVLLERDRETLAELARHDLPGEAWGLCYLADEDAFVLSNGTDALTVRDRATLAVVRVLKVTVSGRPLPSLNELECDGGTVYANVLGSSWIVGVDPVSGAVVKCVDVTGLVARQGAQAGPLNGIAALGDGGFLITGKKWAHLYRVHLVPGPSGASRGAPRGC